MQQTPTLPQSSSFSKGLVLAYQGTFSEDQSGFLLAWSEAYLESQNWPIARHKRGVRCIIELLQNMSKHARSGGYEFSFDPKGVLTLRSFNLVSEVQKIHLQKAIDQAQSPELETMRVSRMDKLVQGDRTKGGGAGLGLMDLRFCSDDHVTSEFIPCGNEQSTFVLTVQIHP